LFDSSFAERRSQMRNLLIAVAIALILTGCGGFTSSMQEANNNNVKLSITPDSIQVKSGDTIWKFSYKVVSSDEKQKTVTAILDHGDGHKENITIAMLEGGVLHITWHTLGINSHWKKIR
jgi:uncharacterized protein YceK